MSSVDKLKLCTLPATLNGLKATVSGVRGPFAKVTQNSTGHSAVFAWDTAARILAKGGEFKRHDGAIRPSPVLTGD